MALWSHKEVYDKSLDKLERIGSGGFGDVYKARHKEWKFDVAIKILHEGSCPLITKENDLFKEANHMEVVSCKFVVKVLGIYQGRPQVGVEQTPMQKGIVMEFMERGSLQSLLNKPLISPLPWPLPLRLAHEVALGMNFLHSKDLLHKDLKPSNVLLDENLNAKLADFGLCRVSTSALKSNREATGVSGGSYKYMPPEAFTTSYEPVRAFDRYSYGILLWTLITGKEPYGTEDDYQLVAFRIPLGDRPLCDDIDLMKPGRVEKMVELMKQCWDHCPSKRPKFCDIAEDLMKEFSKHKEGIHSAVQQVLTRLDSPNRYQPPETNDVHPPFKKPEESVSVDIVDGGHLINTEAPSKQDSVKVPTKRMSDANKAKFVDDQMADLIQTVSVVMAIVEELGNMVHSETYSEIESKSTSQGKMRELYKMVLRSGGEKVKAAFYDALQKHHFL
ncbi:Receptor-interacting serine/threonine-protein kinase 3 [Larimichthys crocea]|uniref:Receptor-interacting serine/threonine-protein kinase 3 n=1 Tax=Larimichthys crocea TaxID=215358 RepID=A0A6G0IYL2_LARCR|nr:Receptor-interacting serine/threonine-protein kinase 3 [Larimichthys crocea]